MHAELLFIRPARLRRPMRECVFMHLSKMSKMENRRRRRKRPMRRANIRYAPGTVRMKVTAAVTLTLWQQIMSRTSFVNKVLFRFLHFCSLLVFKCNRYIDHHKIAQEISFDELIHQLNLKWINKPMPLFSSENRRNKIDRVLFARFSQSNQVEYSNKCWADHRKSVCVCVKLRRLPPFTVKSHQSVIHMQTTTATFVGQIKSKTKWFWMQSMKSLRDCNGQ